ncbi:MAG: hypothetical protein WCK00_05390, partial [Deltaproteobacteria bacterium]
RHRTRALPQGRRPAAAGGCFHGPAASVGTSATQVFRSQESRGQRTDVGGSGSATLWREKPETCAWPGAIAPRGGAPTIPPRRTRTIGLATGLGEA